jgi:hypothetical protein
MKQEYKIALVSNSRSGCGDCIFNNDGTTGYGCDRDNLIDNRAFVCGFGGKWVLRHILTGDRVTPEEVSKHYASQQ